MATPPPGRRLGLSTLIVMGLVLGVGCGLFFGEYCASLAIVGDAFIRLLQMTVLPYIVVVLITNIGGLTIENAKQLGLKGGAALLLFWLVGLAFVLMLPAAFPNWTSSSFFSETLVQPPEPVDLLAIYIPSNIFSSLANNLIPAVVLFSVAGGIALMGVPKKAAVLEVLSALERSLARINVFMVKLSPYGVFAISASALGTMDFGEFGRLQAFVITYIVGALIMAFWALPMLVAALTPFPYRDIVIGSRAAMITGFTTNNLFIILPMLAETARSVMARRGVEDPESASVIGVALPTAFAFPTLGKLLTLVFIPFAAWYMGEPLSALQFPKLIGIGLPSYFAGTSVAIPFVLGSMEMPADLFKLYLLSSIFTERFATVLSAMSLLAFTLLTVCLMGRLAKPAWGRLAALAAVTGGLLLVALPATQAYLGRALRGAYQKDKIIERMQNLANPAPARVFRELPDQWDRPPAGAQRIEWIRGRGVLRVGYISRRLPFSYFNGHDDLVGFDVEMAHRLADELGVRLEFYPTSPTEMGRHLLENRFDVVMSGIPITTDFLTEMRFSTSYLDLTYALLVLDYRRREFATLDRIRAHHVRIGVFEHQYLIERLEDVLPNAEIVPLDDATEVLEGRGPAVDALLMSAEVGSALSLLHPEYGVVIPRPLDAKLPLAYPVAIDDADMAAFMSSWVDLKKKGGLVEQVYNHWILGHQAEPPRPRWSVIRDVLHWVK